MGMDLKSVRWRRRRPTSKWLSQENLITVIFTPNQAESTYLVPSSYSWCYRTTSRRAGIRRLAIIEDDETASCKLPNRWGVDDLPVILQDKRVGSDGQIDYQPT